jgi:hypothetical protein
MGHRRPERLEIRRRVSERVSGSARVEKAAPLLEMKIHRTRLSEERERW